MRVGELTFSAHVLKVKNVFLSRKKDKLLLIYTLQNRMAKNHAQSALKLFQTE